MDKTQAVDIETKEEEDDEGKYGNETEDDEVCVNEKHDGEDVDEDEV